MGSDVQFRRAKRHGTTYALVSLIGSLVATAACDLPSSPPTDPVYEARDRQIDVDGVTLHYREWGREDAQPLIILHGLTGHAWEFDHVAAALAPRYRVLAVNQRGHGASGWGETYSPERMADDVAALIQALQLEGAHVVGHSMGGVNAWWLAARHPERVERLVIIDISPEVITADEVAEFWLAALDAYDTARFADPEQAVAEYLDGYGGQHWEEQAEFVRNNVVGAEEGGWRWRFDALGLKSWIESASGSTDSHWAAVRQIETPTLVVHAGDGPFPLAPSARLAQELKQAELVEIPGAGHDVHIDQRNALVAELLRFLP